MKENNINVFVVDDEEGIVSWILKHVDWENYNCKIAGFSTNPKEALKTIREQPVDLLLTDICMSQMSGLELIRAVREYFPKLMIIVISAYDEFRYVKEAFQLGIINYCLKPIDVDELQECLKTAMVTHEMRQGPHYDQDRSVFRDGFLWGLLGGEIDAFKLKKQSELVGVDISVSSWQVVLMDIDNLEEAKAISLLQYYREQEHKGYYCFLDAYMNLVFILYGEAVSEEESKICRLLKKKIDDSDGLCCIGSPLRNIRQITASYQVCLDFLNAGFLFHRRVVWVGNYDYEKYLNVLKERKLKPLVQALEARDKSSMTEAVWEIVKKCQTEAQKKTECICLAVFLVKKAVHKGYTGGYVDEQASFQDMREWMVDFIEKLVSTQEQKDFMHPCVSYALREIVVRYGDSKLSISEIAQKRYMSSAYLGSIFKEQTGELFNDYLLKYRLEKALEMIEKGSMNMGAIAAATGFASQSYFNKIFRRKFGISPMEYQQKICEEKEDGYVSPT